MANKISEIFDSISRWFNCRRYLRELSYTQIYIETFGEVLEKPRLDIPDSYDYFNVKYGESAKEDFIHFITKVINNEVDPMRSANGFGLRQQEKVNLEYWKEISNYFSRMADYIQYKADNDAIRLEELKQKEKELKEKLGIK